MEDNIQQQRRFEQLRQIYDDFPEPPPSDNSIEQMAYIQDPNSPLFDPRISTDADNTITIPMRVQPGEVPTFRPEDVILQDGDVVFVDTRDTEVYYTGGLLGGGERPLPRDYDLDVLGAVAIAGVGAGVTNQTGGFLNRTVQTLPPTELIVLRRLPGNRQIAIKVDLTEAVNDPRTRILVAAGDTLLLRFKAEEELINFAYGVFFTFGIRELFRNN